MCSAFSSVGETILFGLEALEYAEYYPLDQLGLQFRTLLPDLAVTRGYSLLKAIKSSYLMLLSTRVLIQGSKRGMTSAMRHPEPIRRGLLAIDGILILKINKVQRGVTPMASYGRCTSHRQPLERHIRPTAVSVDR
jgi:hypothetical protein